MNWHSKLIPLILALMICMPWTGWAGANPNNPYCEHDPACWVPIDDGSFGMECCRAKYTSDCKKENNEAGDAFRYRNVVFQSWGRAAGAEKAMQAECKYGFDPAYIGPPQLRDWMRAPGDGDPCRAADAWKQKTMEREKDLQNADKRYQQAVQRLEACEKCRDNSKD